MNEHFTFFFFTLLFKWSLHPSNPFWTSCQTILILVWFSLSHFLLSVFTGFLMPIRERQHLDSRSQTVFANLLLFSMRIHLSKENVFPPSSPSLPSQHSAIISACKVLPKVMVYTTHQVLPVPPFKMSG